MLHTVLDAQAGSRFRPLAAACILAVAGSLGACNQTTAGESQGQNGQVETSCDSCGTIASIEPVKVKGQSSGKGAVAGAIIGGIIGHQFGSGSGNDAATAAGAVGGAMAGNEAEKQYNSYEVYDVVVNLDAGGSRTLRVESAEGFSVGDDVKVVGDRMVHA